MNTAESTSSHLPVSEKKIKKIGANVLVAEGNKVNQQVACAMLEKFDAVLMDGQMPEIDGYDASRKIRQGEAGDSNKAIPIIAVTATAIQEDIRRCFDFCINDFVSKPIEFEDLSCKLKKWVTKESSVIEKSAIQKLKEMATTGNKNLIKDLVLLFMLESTKVIEKMREQAQNDDFVAAARTAHHLKSSCANLGVFKMREITEKIEKIKATGPRHQLLALVDSLEKEYYCAINELKEIMNE